MALVNRRVTYKLYPDAKQHAAMERVCDLHRGLWNAALEERIDAYRKTGASISFSDQCKSLTQIRRECPEYLVVNAQSAQVTLKRLDKAFAAFFRRVKEGDEEPGFPRFKSKHRFPGFGFKTHGDGFKFTPGDNWKHGRLRLTGIGVMQARGEARTPGRIVCADVMRKVDGWSLSLVVECEPHREQTGQRDCGLDWGVETFATMAYSLDDFVEFPNDRLLNQEADAIKDAQRELSKALRGKRSKRAAKARRALARRHSKVANRRKNMLHQRTAELVREHSLIITERLTITNMTASAEGTVEKPGKRVKQKAGLNRAILDTAPGGFLSNLAYKAEEAGCEIVILETRKHKPSQTDPVDGTVKKKALKERTHTLPDGRVIGRDHAAALSMLAAGLRLKGREPAWITSETPARAA
jgi:putative transposase